MHIPIVDLSKLVEVENIKEHQDWVSLAAKVREGLGTVGFLYLTNHGIPEQVISDVFSQSQKFFALDNEVKLKYKKDTRVEEGEDGKKTFDIEKYFGYTPTGGEKLHPDARFELKETFDWIDNVEMYPDAELPNFEPSIALLDKECKTLLKKLLTLMAISLGMEDVDFFVKCCRHFDDPKEYKGIYNIRVLHYPPLKDDAESSKAVRLGSHTDYGFITLLFQDNTGGLEVQTVDGEWVEAKPIPGSILVNTGDLVEFWTCGIFPATPHRVILPEMNDKKRHKSRYSVAFFNSPDSDLVLTPIDLPKQPKETERLAKTDLFQRSNQDL